jgi:hypothetical protein
MDFGTAGRLWPCLNSDRMLSVTAFGPQLPRWTTAGAAALTGKTAVPANQRHQPNKGRLEIPRCSALVPPPDIPFLPWRTHASRRMQSPSLAAPASGRKPRVRQLTARVHPGSWRRGEVQPQARWERAPAELSAVKKEPPSSHFNALCAVLMTQAKYCRQRSIVEARIP